MDSNAPLPYGWIKQLDPQSGHVFFVDTKSSPPRSIWTHPYEDEQYLEAHPEVRSKVRGPNGFGSDASLPLPPNNKPRRHSFNGREATPVDVPPPPHKKGFIAKMKDKARHSMEEYNERKKRELLMMQQQQQQMYGQSRYGAPRYGAPQFAAPSYAYPQARYGMGMGMGGRRGGMGGMALPLMGGMAGGLLLGDMLDNDFGGGGWDGGGGGDWGGGFGGGGLF